ncbi:MAG: hypothetical protein KAU21_10510 [Gammaproteobacteria bacterium]|nr:hypothetical protein [Gammaproteobacteria bacterium]
MKSDLDQKFKSYYLTAIFSLIFAVAGFSYNAWRLEVTEDNSNIRTAAFEVLTELSELQQLIYSSHYDHDKAAGNPRIGWVKIGLIIDLSVLISRQAENKSVELKNSWSDNWEIFEDNRTATDELIVKIDSVRNAIKLTLKNLD